MKSKEHGRASSSQKWEIGEKDAAKATTNKKEVLATSQKSKENYSSNVSAKVTKARERGAEESSSKDKKPVASTKQNFEKASARVSPTKALVHPQVQAPKLSFMIVRFRQRG